MAELTIILDPTTGGLLIEEPALSYPAVRAELDDLLGPRQSVACAAPPTVLTLPSATAAEAAAGPCVRLAGYWHDSVIEGPGRRSVAKLQGCPIRCQGCLTPDSWDPTGGFLVPVSRLADTLLDSAHERDGVTILGGEPFAQPQGLLALVRALRARGAAHILCYSGYTLEALQRRAIREPVVGAVLDEIDVLIDGPFVAALADGGGPWVGSRNQRVIPNPGSTVWLNLRNCR